ncbi:LysR family transcriptional regulator [uncultured Roseibium sp.]|uniref:LysR family transcriptional regulator n=1 Tax=uncultured Roseibium sp. TaxID=1936171 RepID=UPI002638CEDD|nr:LysR family transcriptional regulator [uncultured Roseibium sp.]
MNDLNWDDLKIFRLVASLGSLSRAADKAGISAATAGRKVQRLEGHLGADLFSKTHAGYELTQFGQQLLERTSAVARTVGELKGWRDRVLNLPLVTIAAPVEIQWILYRRFRELWNPSDPFRVAIEECVDAHLLLHNKSVLLITPDAPTTGNLKTVQIGTLKGRPYVAKTFDQKTDCNWIGLHQRPGSVALSQPTSFEAEDWVTTWAASFDGLVSLVRGNTGRALLPDFIGVEDETLVLAEDDVRTFDCPLYLASHGDASTRTEISVLKRRLKSLLSTVLK